ncbi:hypothetical protein FHR83_007488 [Actinoplanes campanulatus]|uniref:Uncharacterized protein n=1 Tax=Actinoplanes campanulatus TaxID=113559 RepID=A0A7W5APD5_9ACTN|nr:hypothetical protein [Actinoplanes campanulatus]GGN47055.1 hypothetical protein GCM10010109_82900 [Actinoplanes campanulatus]GID42355.1 hypothetical protein Aca09nite_88610 [Actinoplanes campanulatus]
MRHYPRVQAWWERFLPGRKPRCAACGVQWMCDEAIKERNRKRAGKVRNDRTGTWVVYTDAYPQVGRAGSLTPAQERRSHGGASC